MVDEAEAKEESRPHCRQCGHQHPDSDCGFCGCSAQVQPPPPPEGVEGEMRALVAVERMAFAIDRIAAAEEKKARAFQAVADRLGELIMKQYHSV